MLLRSSWAAPAALALVSIGNAAAWAQVVPDVALTPGGVAFFCTVAIPLLGGAFIYLIKNVWPPTRDAYFDFLQKRDEARSKLLGGQMATLTASLNETNRKAGSLEELLKIKEQLIEAGNDRARAAEARADAAEARADEQTRLLKDLTANLAEANKRIEESNKKGHQLLNEAQKTTTRHEEEKLELAAQLVAVRGELSRANDQLAGLRVENTDLMARLAADVAETKTRAETNSARIDAIAAGASGSSDSITPIPLIPPGPA